MSNKYKKAMDEIVMSDELKAKILDKACQQNTAKKKMPFIYSKKYIGMAACLAVCAVFAYFVSGRLSMNDMKIKEAEESKPKIEYKIDKEEKNLETEVNNTTEESTKEPIVKEAETKNIPQKDDAVINSKTEVLEDYSEAVETEEAVQEKAEEAVVSEDTAMAKMSGGGGASAARMMPEDFAEEIVEETDEAVVEEEAVDESAEVTTAAYNPVEYMESIEKIEETLGVDIKTPVYIPSGYSEDSRCVIGGTVAEINYIKGNDEICYRTEKGNENISGDYNVYEKEEQLPIDDMTVTVKGADGLVNRADWTDGEYSYSIGSNNGIQYKEIVKIIKGIK